MTRPVKYSLILLPLAIVIYGSFACGQMLRRATLGPVSTHNRISSLPESGIGATADNAQSEEPQDTTPEETFLEVLRYVKTEYVDKIEDDKKLGFGAVRTMLLSLDDPKTRFYEPEQRKQLLEQLNGQFNGIGAVFSVIKAKRGEIDQRRLAVVAPILDGPADKAGLRPGDVITEVDGKWVIAYDPRLDLDKMNFLEMEEKERTKVLKEATKKLTDGMSLQKALDQLNGKPGKTFTLTVERAGVKEPLKVSVATGVTKVEPVEFKAVNGEVGYLRVTQFNDRATTQFTDVLKDAKQKSLIVDLRDNTGGPITSRQNGALGSALALLGKLTGGGRVGTLVRKGNVQELINVPPGGTARFKIVVLMNGGTANLAEMVASALKEKAGAKLIGGNTFGDSVYQRLVELQDGAAMTITAGKLLTASGADFTGKGLIPDVPLATGRPHAGDPTVERALSVLSGA